MNDKLKDLLNYATEYYCARAKAEKYYNEQKERLSDLMCHSDNGEEYQKINDTYRTLKMEELSAWENYYQLLNMVGYEYESVIKSMLRYRHNGQKKHKTANISAASWQVFSIMEGLR